MYILGLSLIQIILATVAVVFITISVMRFGRKERGQTGFKLISSCIVWGGILVTALFPKWVLQIARSLGMGENLNTLIFTGFVIAFALIFRMLGSIEHLERTITLLVRKEALKDLDKQKHEKKT